jgi:hypothetical protein
MPSSKSSQLNPSRLIKHLRTRLVQIPHHILTARMEPWGFFKSSTLYLSIHMKLSLRLSFYLKRSLGGYTVHMTVRFQVELVEALAPMISPSNPTEVSLVPYENCSNNRRVTGFSHPLNTGLGGYCRVNLPKAPHATGYNTKPLYTIGSLQ